MVHYRLEQSLRASDRGRSTRHPRQNAVEARTRIAARVFEFRVNGAVLRPCQAQRQRLRDIAARASALSPLGMDDTYIVRCPPSAVRPKATSPTAGPPGHRTFMSTSPALAACAQPCPTWCVISKVSSACAIARSRQSWRELRSSFPVLTVKQQAWPGRLGLPRTGADSSCIRAGPAASPPSQRGSREALSWLFCAAACVHAQSSVRCRASTIPCGFGTSGADFLPVQNGPETVGLDGGGAASAVGLRLGGIVTFCCSLSRLAAVQGSSLIVSLPRFVRRVEGSDYNTRREENAGLSLKTKTRPRTRCSGRSQSRPFSVLARAVSDGWKAYPALLLVEWRLCAGLSGHNFRYWKLSGSVAAVPVRLLDPGFTEPTRGH
jgi:hypothetical protein